TLARTAHRPARGHRSDAGGGWPRAGRLPRPLRGGHCPRPRGRAPPAREPAPGRSAAGRGGRQPRHRAARERRVTVQSPRSAALERERAAADAAVRRALDALPEGDGPVVQAVRYALAGGGKRLRPVLCAGAWRAVAGREPPAAVYDAAAAIELVHTYSLVHDDLPIMDDDDLRRGRPTVHRVHGTAVAMAAGAALIPFAAGRLTAAAQALGLEEDVVAAVGRELARAAGAGGMVGGQLLDLEAEGHALTVDALEAIHARKTGALFVASLRTGGLLARGSTAQVDALGEYGAALGLAFQIADDVLDETADS